MSHLGRHSILAGAIAIYSHAIVLVSAACAVGHFMPGAWVDATQWMYRIWDDQRMKLTARLGRQVRCARQDHYRLRNAPTCP